MTQAELQREFFKVAKLIKQVCEHKSVSTCMDGKCPFSTIDGICAFEGCNFGQPYDWEFQNDLFVNLTEKEKGEG